MAPKAAARGPIVSLLMLLVVPIMFHIALVAITRVHTKPGFSLFGMFKFGLVTASALTHWAIYCGLLLTFALTLRPGHTALITALAQRMQGPLSDELTVYTRRVTIAWVGFFATQLAISIGLFCFAPLVAWSFFVNVLDLPLVAAMFGAEYMFRLRHLSEPPRHSVATIFKMVSDMRSAPESSAMIP
jgi:uncharacterized membrane protein